MVPSLHRLRASDLPSALRPFALVHVTSGELLLGGDGIGQRFVAGDLFSLRAAAEIELRPGRRDVEALALHADPAWVARVRALFGEDHDLDPGDAFVCERAGSELARRAGRLLLAVHLAQAAAGTDGAIGGADTGVGLEAAGPLLELIGLAHRMTGSGLSPRPSGVRPRARRAPLVRALEELEGADLDGFSLGVLARRLGVSERHASRLVREELGTSFQDYLSALRVERAKKLLAGTSQSVTDIALETGWQSVSHFNAVFRRRVGVTPSRYRAECGGGDGDPLDLAS